MSQESLAKDKKEFRSLVLQLKKLNPSWQAKEITKLIVQWENQPNYTTSTTLRVKVWRILKRNTIDDLPRSGVPRTTTSTEYLQAVKANIEF